MTSDEQILIVGPSWVGDMVMAQSLFRQLLADQPDAKIDVVAPGWSTGILARMPEVRNAYVLAAGHGELALGARRRLGQQLRAVGYGRSIVLPRSFKAALVPWFAHIPERTGFRGEMRYGLLTDVRKLDKQRYDQTVKRFIALGVDAHASLPAISRPALTIDKKNQSELLQKLQLRDDGRSIALMPGAAYGPAKMWPAEYFAELATMLVADDYEVWIIGSEGERQAAEKIAGPANSGIKNLCGATGLDDTVDLFAATKAAITNDSGLMHVAAAAGTRVIAIYGSSSPTFTPPLTEHKTIHHLDLECSPCHKRECPLGHLRCLREITPAAIRLSI